MLLAGPKLVFANIASYVMLSVLDADYVRSLHAVTPRVIWIAEAGDILVTARPISESLLEYACEVLDLDSSKIVNFAPQDGLTRHLATAVQEEGMLDDILVARSARPDVLYSPFALDRPALQVGRELELTLEGYKIAPSEYLVDEVYRLNTKSGFRERMTEFGYRVPPGRTCRNLDELVSAARYLWQDWEQIIIKLDRSSNGYGHRVIARPDSDKKAKELICERLVGLESQPYCFTVEAFLPVEWRPSVEMHVRDDGVHFLYLSDQYCPNHSFAGLITPPLGIPQVTCEQLCQSGMALGKYLFSYGYRGVFDVDACVTTDGTLYLTETNLRQTGGTYLHVLVQRLLGADYSASGYVWWQNTVLNTNASLTFEVLLQELRRRGILLDGLTKRGVLPLVDTAAIDGKWRYLLLAKDVNEAAEYEREVQEVLRPR